MTEALHAVIPPPEVARFREMTGTVGQDLELDTTGWSKVAVLSPDRRFGRPWTSLEELAVLGQLEAVLASLGLAIASWHSLAPASIPPELSSPPLIGAKRWLDALLDGSAGAASVAELTSAWAPDRETLAAWLPGSVPRPRCGRWSRSSSTATCARTSCWSTTT